MRQHAGLVQPGGPGRSRSWTTANASSSPPAPIKPIEPPKVYTVVQGDTLYGISVKLFGTPRHYERIYEANKDRVKDPGTLQIGVNLRMPEVPSTAKAAE